MSPASRTIAIAHLGRVEGHGGIFVRIGPGGSVEVDLDIYEGSRYYEELLLGKRHDEVQGIITRICAICSGSHTVAALTALEAALGVQVSERTVRLRDLLLLGSTVESHALHLFALALPDFLGCRSVLEMAEGHREQVAFALRLKQLGNRIQAAVGGRAVHPVNALVGGFASLPSPDCLRELRRDLEAASAPLAEAVELTASLALPGWADGSPTYVALRPPGGEYGYRGDTLCTSRGEAVPAAHYGRLVREFTRDRSDTHHAAPRSGESYVVGALARLRLWGARLSGRAREAHARLLPRGAPETILRNNWAQLVELIHCTERAADLCQALLEMPPDDVRVADVAVGAGRGIGAIEAPRGTLIHDYELDRHGRVAAANVVTPTAQNLASVERDLREAARRILESDPDAVEASLPSSLEMVARAYDPCISCSVHVTRTGP